MLTFLLAACAPEKSSAAEDSSPPDTACVPVSGWLDADGDGFGAGGPVEACAGLVANGDDCDDADAAVHPSAEEDCDGLDDDCDGQIDDRADGTCEGTDVPEFDGTYALGEADAKLYGPASYDLGRFVEVGDLTGDGIDDALVATMLANSGNGGGFVLPGPLTGLHPAEEVGYFLGGARASTGAGRSIGLGDVNGDGFMDVSFGSPYNVDANGTWILFGPFDAARDLVEERDVYLRGPWGSMAGHGGDLADIDGDGIEDALIGCWSDGTGGSDAGSVFVKYGPLATGDMDLATEADAHLVGEGENAQAGRLTRGGVDLDGDGIGDLIALAPFSSVVLPSAGVANVVYGPPMGELDMSAADGRILGTAPDEYAGWTAALGEDVNGDGLGDVLVGSLPDRVASNAGAVSVIYGPAAGDISLADAAIVIEGVDAEQWVSSSIATDDVDGDGFSDLLTGALFDATGGVDSGGAYFFWAPAAGAYTTADADASLYGEASGDWAGLGVAMGDLDADGWGDLLVSAPSEDSGGSAGGALYVQYAIF